MSLKQFMLTNLDVIRDEIIKNITTEKFDSHEFIRNFIKRYEVEYVQFLHAYQKEPFRNVNAQIGKFLSEHQVSLQIKDDGVTKSPNVFGDTSQNERWEKK
jgi:hypothetical protein